MGRGDGDRESRATGDLDGRGDGVRVCVRKVDRPLLEDSAAPSSSVGFVARPGARIALTLRSRSSVSRKTSTSRRSATVSSIDPASLISCFFWRWRSLHI
jgi:hypothetical protein